MQKLMRIRMKQLLSFLYFLALSLSGYGGINYSYDASGNRMTLRKEIIIRQITPEKEETSLQDPVRLPAVKDFLGGVTRTEYDVWGHVVRDTFPDSTERTVTREWSGGTAGSLFRITERSTGQPDRRTYADALGRTVRTEERSLDGGWLSVVKEYDGYGRLYRESRPSKTSPSQWTSYTYDDMDRTVQVTRPDNTADTYGYSGLTRTVTSRGITITGTYSTLGDLLTSECGGQTTSYTYNGDGQPALITAPGNITTSMTYSGAGLRTLLADPSAGSVATTYDNLCRVWRTKDARNNIIQYGYDTHDRVTMCRHNGEDTTSLAYDGYGRLVSEQGGDGHGVAYTYDALGRTASRTVTLLDGRWLRQDCA